MRGSQWEGEGRGPGIGLERILIAAGIVIAVSLAVVYYVQVQTVPGAAEGELTTITTTGTGCGGGSVPQVAASAEADPRFVALSGGLCYNYMGESSPQGGAPVLTFDYYNGTVVYECGTTAYDVVAGQIEANVTSAGAIGSVWAPSQGLNPPQACPAPPPVSVVSVEDVSSLIPAIPQLNVTLQASPGSQPITSLKASLTLVGSVQQFVFVAHPGTLAAGREVSKVEITSSSAPYSSGVLYPMTVTGTFADGQTFTVQAYVQVAGLPPA